MGHTAVSAELLNVLLVPMVLIWVLHLYQRKFRDTGARKRSATQWLTFLVIGLWAVAWLFRQFGVPDEWLLAAAAVAAGVLVWRRRVLLPFSRRCAQCGKTVPVVSMMCLDSNTCEACGPPTTEGETSA
ncbi:MAG TPA: hypothetical protein VFI08_03730 [Spirochaetia bacterium]|nr:hypothetical protein [Spirochaetia bacterium]